MKRKQSTEEDGSEWWTETELEIAQLILVLRRGCLLSRIPFTWGLKRKRSAIQDDTPSPSSSQKHHGGAVVAPSCNAEIQAVVKEEALSPTTPLSFPTPESDEKTKPSPRKTKTSLKKKRENCLQVIEYLTKTKDSLNQEIENVKRHRNQLKAFNLKLKAREQELNNGPKSECKNPHLEIGQAAVQLGQSNGSVKSSKSTAENEKQKKQQQQMQMQMQMQLQMEMEMANQNQNLWTSNGEGVVQFLNMSGHPTTSLPMESSSSYSVLGRNLRNVDNNAGPLLLPDLNLSIEELTNVDSCQPLDENATTDKDLSRAMAAQARQRRLQIFRLKKPIGNNSKPHQFHR